MTVALYQGGTEIETFTPATTTSWTTFSHTLTTGEADLITDYDDLRIRIVANNGTETATFCSWAELELPGHIHTATGTHTHGATDSTTLSTDESDSDNDTLSHDHAAINPDSTGHTHTAPNSGATGKTTSTVQSHNHTFTLPSHNHTTASTDEADSQATDTTAANSHAHDMTHNHTAGIFETEYSAPAVGIIIDGVDRSDTIIGIDTKWGVDQTDIDITSFVNTKGAHVIQFFENADSKMGRIQAAIIINTFIRGS